MAVEGGYGGYGVWCVVCVMGQNGRSWCSGPSIYMSESEKPSLSIILFRIHILGKSEIEFQQWQSSSAFSPSDSEAKNAAVDMRVALIETTLDLGMTK